NTGELGRPYSAGGTVVEDRPSLEWPPNSRIILDRQNFPGHHNSFGSGIWLAATGPNGRRYAFSGAVSNDNGEAVPVVGVHSIPIEVRRIENYPVLADGSLNPTFDPDEAEEIIISSWDTPTGIRVRRTSRAWSYPGYDSFIIYEYEFENITQDVLRDVFITFAGTYAPSMFGYQRNHGEGLPEDACLDMWSQPGGRGGLNAPQAAGMLILHYDYEHLASRAETQQVFLLPADSLWMWDENGKAKQPFLLRYENGNLYEG